MKLLVHLLCVAALLVHPAHAAVKDEIASMDKTMVRACEVAEIDAARAKENATETFLRVLSLLETRYRNARDEDSLLACRKARAKYDPTAEKVDQPTKIPEQLRVLVSAFEGHLGNRERYKLKTIADAQDRRTRNLTALQRGLVQRGDKEGARLVFEALKNTPPLPKPDTTPSDAGTLVPQDVMFLTYIRPKKRWEKFEAEGVRREVAEGTTTLHYAEGEHALLKVIWPDVLEVGDRFFVEVKGAISVEMVDLDGADANARTSLPTADAFVTVEIAREKDQVTFTCDGQPQKPYYASDKLRGDDAKAALLATPLRAGFAVKKGESASFRNAKIIKP